MLKTGCVFDREKLKEFYQKLGRSVKFDNGTMFFALYDNDEIIGTTTMFKEEDDCRITDAVKAAEVDFEREEFLIKSAINFALTFNAKNIVMSKHYEEFLLSMGFSEKEGELFGKMSEIDFPSKCKHE